ncbi:hypothetical protein D039_4177A, partial [Vibrio parahaemolyticus EKP-028]
MRVKLAASQKL